MISFSWTVFIVNNYFIREASYCFRHVTESEFAKGARDGDPSTGDPFPENWNPCRRRIARRAALRAVPARTRRGESRESGTKRRSRITRGRKSRVHGRPASWKRSCCAGSCDSEKDQRKIWMWSTQTEYFFHFVPHLSPFLVAMMTSNFLRQALAKVTSIGGAYSFPRKGMREMWVNFKYLWWRPLGKARIELRTFVIWDDENKTCFFFLLFLSWEMKHYVPRHGDHMMRFIVSC